MAEINSMLTQTASAEQRSLFEDSNLDDVVLGDEQERQRRRRVVDERAGVLARGVPPDPRRGPDAVGDRHRDLPRLPAALQVRAGVLRAEGADAPAALRDPRAPGARALPHPARQPGGADGRRGGARADARHAHVAVRDGLAAPGLRRVERGAPAAREGGRLAGALPPALRRRGGLTGVVRAQLLVPDRPAPAARPRRPRGPPARRLLRADRLQDRPGADALPAQGRHPAVAVPDRRQGVVEARVLAPELLLRAGRREGPARADRGGRDPHHGHGDRGRDRDPRAGVRPDAVLLGLLDLRLPADLPGS